MKKYCFDTSGISNPWEEMPDPPFGGMWTFVRGIVASGEVAVTREVFDEMCLIGGGLGDFIKTSQDQVLCEVNQGDWDWAGYLKEAGRIAEAHKQYVSDWTGGSSKTVCLKDISGIALASTLKLPLLSGEKAIHDLVQSKKRHIPDLCRAEGVSHYSFTEFLVAAGYKG